MSNGRVVLSSAAVSVTRFNSLDALRGLAALSVVFWHWQHFFFVRKTLPPGFDPTLQPLFGVFRLLYEFGWYAVDLFFVLSGFVFFWKYSHAISLRAVSARTFFILRASRLYPLHIATLAVVLCGQKLYWHIAGTTSYFVYTNNNDLYHFVLNVLMLTSVGLERGHSFNGPFWSVSVEVLLYFLFFLFSLRIIPLLGTTASRITALALLAACGLAIWTMYDPIGRGVFSFFVGGIVYYTFACIAANQNWLSRYAIPVATLAVLGWLGVCALVYVSIPMQDVMLTTIITSRMAQFFPQLMLFPITVLAIALIDASYSPSHWMLASLGNISYSVYLWHFPLQLLFALGASILGLGSAVFSSVATLAVFFALLIALSHLSFTKFEMPMQTFLRSSLSVKKSPRGHLPKADRV